MKKVLFTLTVLLLVAAFGISAFMVGSYLINTKKQEDLNNELAQIVADAQNKPRETQPAANPEETTRVTETTEEGGILPGYKELYEQNSDMVGWIEIPGTELAYPVLQTPNSPDYYLYRNFLKAESKEGAIYAREVCDVNEPSDNITIYGHNMANGHMFAALNAYAGEASYDYWEQNSLIFFDTLTEYHTYKIFAVFKTSANLNQGFSYHQFVDAANAEEFDNFVKTCKDLSFYDTGITPVYGDKLICLSTCEYTLENGRLVVAAVRIT